MMKWLCMYLRRIASRYWRVHTLSVDTRTVKSYKRSTVEGVSSEIPPLIPHCHNHYPPPPPVVTADIIMRRISMKQGRGVSRPTGCSLDQWMDLPMLSYAIIVSHGIWVSIGDKLNPIPHTMLICWSSGGRRL